MIYLTHMKTTYNYKLHKSCITYKMMSFSLAKYSGIEQTFALRILIFINC